MSLPNVPPPPPRWVSSVVILGSLGALIYNATVVGPEGLPYSYILGGLVAAYGGVDRILRRKKEDGDEP